MAVSDLLVSDKFFLSSEAENGDERPEVQVKAASMPTAIDEAEQVLVKHARGLGIFQHHMRIVKVITLDEPRADRRLTRPAGTVLLKSMKRLGLMETLDRLVHFKKWSKKESKLVSAGCPPQLAGTYLEREGEWRLPHLRGTISAPLLRPDGTVITVGGYDDATALYLVSNCEWLTVPEDPNRLDAQKALATLLAPFAEFPFVGEADKAVVIAGILTALQRRLLGPCPLFCFSAPTPRTGKSLLSEAIAIIAMGKPASASSVSSDFEELRKSLTASLREGLLIINLDNVVGELSSADLSKILTQEEFSDRLLGETETLRLPTNCLWTATGNNLTLRGDLAVRALMCKIDAEQENPEHRRFKILDLKAHLTERRPELVRNALTILRAFHVAGRPSQVVEPWGGFDDWSRSIREPLVWAGLTDPCATREVVMNSDPEKEIATGVLKELSNVFGEAPFYSRDVMEKANKETVTKNLAGEEKREYSYSELRNAVATAASKDKEIDANKLGRWLRNWNRRPTGGLMLLQCGGSNPKKWVIAKTKREGTGRTHESRYTSYTS